MQGKESLEQGAKPECSVGVDVSKSWLDVRWWYSLTGPPLGLTLAG